MTTSFDALGVAPDLAGVLAAQGTPLGRGALIAVPHHVEVQVVGLGERAQFLLRSGGNPDEPHIARLQVGHDVTEAGGLDRASGRAGLGEEVDHNLLGIVQHAAEGNDVVVLVEQGEVGTDLTYCWHGYKW